MPALTAEAFYPYRVGLDLIHDKSIEIEAICEKIVDYDLKFDDLADLVGIVTLSRLSVI